MASYQNKGNYMIVDDKLLVKLDGRASCRERV